MYIIRPIFNWWKGSPLMIALARCMLSSVEASRCIPVCLVAWFAVVRFSWTKKAEDSGSHCSFCYRSPVLMTNLIALFFKWSTDAASMDRILADNQPTVNRWQSWRMQWHVVIELLLSCVWVNKIEVDHVAIVGTESFEQVSARFAITSKQQHRDSYNAWLNGCWYLRLRMHD